MRRFRRALRGLCCVMTAVIVSAGSGAADAAVALMRAPVAISRVTTPAPQTVAARRTGTIRRAAAVAGPTLVGETFTGVATTANGWYATGSSCLTAGSAATPATSIAACGTQATADAPGAGALQLTGNAGYQSGMVVDRTALPTANGLQVIFNDYAFNGTAPGADGITLFLSDAAQPLPTAAGVIGGSLAYANATLSAAPSAPGIANAYIGIGLDQYGNFSNPTQARNGGPGLIPQTIAVRGAAATNWTYLGGALNTAGAAASLPFALDTPAAKTRPATPLTIVATLTATGTLSVAIDRHDGNGAVTYYAQNIVGVNGEPAVPANVYLGFTGSTGGSYTQHQISSLSVTSLAAVTPTPAPTPPPATGFTPAAVNNLAAWYDAATATSITRSGTAVTGWADLSGYGNALVPGNANAAPAYVAGGINGLGSVAFSGAQYLLSSNAAFSTNLLNESTVFAVANQTNTADSSLIWSGAYFADPRWTLRLSEAGVSHFDFNNHVAGRLAAADKPTGAALWTATGSVSNHSQQLRKNGNMLASAVVGSAAVTGSYPLAIGAMASAAGGPVQYNYSGQLGEVVVYHRSLTAAETAKVEGYLACKWGLQTRLPANHPYRNVCPQGGTYPSQPIAPPAAGALRDPMQLRSANGSLSFNVKVQSDPATGNPEYLYNGSAVPPTLRLLPGDTLNVTLSNALPTPPAGALYTNNTNLHYHGLHVSPQAPGDDSIDMLAAPGQTLSYRVAIPANHPTGLYWYHAHAHGEAERQTLAGMSGALIIDGIVTSAPQVANLPERVLIVRDAPLAGVALPNVNRVQIAAMKWSMLHGTAMNGMRTTAPLRVAATNTAARNPYVTIDRNYRRFVRGAVAADTQCSATAAAATKALTVNGQTQPSIGIRPGEQQFWRVVNAGADTYLDLQIDNTTMSVVALDGVPLASGVNTPASMTISHWVLPPASRVEFVVTGPPAGTTAYLRTNCFDSGAAGQAMPATILASINSTTSLSDQTRMRRAQRFSRSAHSAGFRSAARLHALAVSNTRTIYYSDQNNINGIAYDPAAAPMFYAQSGTTEEWTIQNNSAQVHTFHIHQVHFLVEAVNGVAQSQQYVMDNVNVPAATASGPGSVKVLLDFTDPAVIGTFLLHCHILSHEDGGMMAKIRIGLAPPLQLSTPSITFAGAAAPVQSVSIAGGQAPYGVSGCAGVAKAAVTTNTVTLTPAAAGSCVLTIADSSNPGITATVAVTVNAGAAAITLQPNALSFAAANAAAQNVAISGGTAPYSVAGCNGVITGSLNGATLTIAPASAGACTLNITDAATNSASLSISVNAATSGSPQDNVTFHQNTQRTGWYKSEATLTTANVAGGGFAAIASLTAPAGMPAFGKVYAQPLYVTNEVGPDGVRHNLVIIATSTDQVYAFDDQTRAVVWHRSYTNAGAGIRQQLWSDTSCSDINPDVGIIATPVIDRAADRMFFTAATMENGTPYLRLHSIALGTGNEIAATPITGAVALATGGSATIDPRANLSRSALLEANGNIYVSLASHCDFGAATTHGWVIAYSASTLQQTASAVDLTNANPGNSYFLGSPWMSGFGPASDAQGNVYVATGNGPFNGTTNFSMSVLKLPGNLNLGAASYFTPATAAADSNQDADLGSGGVLLLPDQATGLPHLLVQGGKCGAAGCMKYILNRDALGGQQTNDAGAVWKASTGGGIWGGPAYFQDAGGRQYIVYGTGAPLNTYQITSPAGLAVQSSANIGCLECRDSGSQPVVSSNGTAAGTAIVWALKTPGNGGGAISLYAFDALNMSHTLFNGNAGNWVQAAGAQWMGGALVSPLVANGRVYVPVDGAVTVFGLH